MVEMEVAFAVFGVILAGLCPVVVAQLKHAKKLEDRFRPGVAYYVVPRAEPWSRKLAGTATVTASPGGSSGPAAAGANLVSVVSLAASPNVEDASAVVQVVPIPAPPK